MCGMTTRLQELLTVSTNTSQALDKAVDLKDYGRVSVRINFVAANSDGYLVLEESPVQDSAGFQPVRYFHGDSARVETVQMIGLQRWLRWRWRDRTTGSVSFQIDLTARP